eukprot:2585002-Ditylum_brightwellii.AAC.1
MEDGNTSPICQENNDSTNRGRCIELFKSEVPRDPENNAPSFYCWSPLGIWYRDLLHFVDPGWFICIAYVDPENYQAYIQAAATLCYNLLWML